MKVSFCSPGMYNFFHEDAPLMHGGAEVQLGLVGRRLRDNGVEVSIITGDFGQPFIEEKDGFKLVKIENKAGGAGLAGVLISNLAGLEKAMRTADADVYYQRGRGTLTGKVALVCRRLGRPFVFGAASDTDCGFQKSAYRSSNLYERTFYLWGLRRAGAVVAQTEYQKKLLKEKLGIESRVISNCFPAVEAGEKDSPPKVLWVGEIYRPLKRAEVFIRLAEALPGVEFIMVAGPEGAAPEKYAEVRARAVKLGNVEFLGYVPYKDIHSHFKRSSALVDTSAVAGFHNTFLQAWANGNPVVSLEIDPDGLLERRGLGFRAGSFDKLIELTKKLAEDAPLRQEIGERAREFVRDEHSVEKAGALYLELFENAIIANRRKNLKQS